VSGCLIRCKLAIHHLYRQFFRRKDPAEVGADSEFVPACIKRRVGEHRNTGELESVQRGRKRVISPAASSVGMSAFIFMEVKFVLGIIFRLIASAGKRVQVAQPMQ
jgi:hypothetical protein